MTDRDLGGKPKITKDPDSGMFRLDGTRIKVWMIVSQAKLAEGLDQARQTFIQDYPWLTGAHFDAAMFYYQFHQEEVDKEIEESRRLQRLLGEHSSPKTGIVDVEAMVEDPEYQRL